jgi:metal-responsive CopG/Arc/MetJ family transcriptional regulator
MRSTQNVCLTLPTDKVREIDQVAEAEKRSRSNLVLVAMDEYIAARNITGQSRIQRARAMRPTERRGLEKP